MEETFAKVVARVFSNWTALRLAVEHKMGGSNSLQVALSIADYVAQYCTCDPRVDVEGIQDVIEDLMDEEFDTICEDESIKEISHILYNFVNLLRESNTAGFEEEFNKLPPLQEWLLKPQNHAVSQTASESSEDEQAVESENTMEVVESEWTEVKSKKRK